MKLISSSTDCCSFYCGKCGDDNDYNVGFNHDYDTDRRSSIVSREDGGSDYNTNSDIQNHVEHGIGHDYGSHSTNHDHGAHSSRHDHVGDSGGCHDYAGDDGGCDFGADSGGGDSGGGGGCDD